MNSSDTGIFQLKLIPLLCVVIASGLFGWSITSLAAENMEILVGIGAGVMTALMLGLAVCCSPGRHSTMIKVASICFAVVGIILNIVLAYFCKTVKPYVIVWGLDVMFWVISIYTLYKRKLA